MSFNAAGSMPDMSADEATVFEYQFARVRKSAAVAITLAIFLGGLGAHHFYMRRTGLGFLYLAFCWTLVPTVVALIEALFMRRRVARHNRSAAAAIAAQLRLLGRPVASPAA